MYSLKHRINLTWTNSHALWLSSSGGKNRAMTVEFMANLFHLGNSGFSDLTREGVWGNMEDSVCNLEWKKMYQYSRFTHHWEGRRDDVKCTRGSPVMYKFVCIYLCALVWFWMCVCVREHLWMFACVGVWVCVCVWVREICLLEAPYTAVLPAEWGWQVCCFHASR